MLPFILPMTQSINNCEGSSLLRQTEITVISVVFSVSDFCQTLYSYHDHTPANHEFLIHYDTTVRVMGGLDNRPQFKKKIPYKIPPNIPKKRNVNINIISSKRFCSESTYTIYYNMVKNCDRRKIEFIIIFGLVKVPVMYRTLDCTVPYWYVC